MGTRERRDRAKHQTRQMILDAARALFNEVGFSAFTMRTLAERIEYTPTAIYHHFESKEALVTELCHQDFGQLAEHLQTLVHIADPVERIRGVGEAFLEFAIRYPNHYRFMFMSGKPAVEHSPEYLAERKGNPEEDAYAFFVRAVEEAIRQDRLRPEFTDAHEVVQMLWGAAHGIISLHLSMSHDAWVPWRDLADTVRQVNRLLIQSLVRDAAAVPAVQVP